MADRVHPGDSPPSSGEASTTSSSVHRTDLPLKPSHPVRKRPDRRQLTSSKSPKTRSKSPEKPVPLSSKSTIMADRVHPGDSPPFSGEASTTSSSAHRTDLPLKPSHPVPENESQI
ncbi:hypothetical protein LOK49_LG12G00771 [Camellia lanceoleosa]|uniref:Uncharacterized protein n=1 Tax=Camellia lanceoleosa TaxID=1840588 RepID=A0ACC0FY83_9ERIC|nr:hypothetical protein LOK49_LG12G00771 [Camellia lanceoleosa]